MTQNADSVRVRTLIQCAENGVVHLSAYGFATACGQALEWGFYAIGEEVPVSGQCPQCLPSEQFGEIIT